MSHLEVVSDEGRVPLWAALRAEAREAAGSEPRLASMLNATILAHDALGAALSYQIARKLGDQELRAMSVREVTQAAYRANPDLLTTVEADLRAVFERDPACRGYLQPFLFFKGFQALQSHRIAHHLWNEGREMLAFHFQSKISELYQIDIHPAVRMGSGIFIDHGTGIVIGETAVVGDDVSMLQDVTLGGTGKESGDRHPKIGKGVLLAAGAKVLGNIVVGDYAKVAAGSVVLIPVPPGCTVAGVPAKLVNCPTCAEPAKSMDQTLGEYTGDYVI